MNIYLFLIEKYYTIVESIYKLWENTSFYNSNINDEGRNKSQVIFNLKENQGKSLINSKQMVFDEHIHFFHNSY